MQSWVAASRFPFRRNHLIPLPAPIAFSGTEPASELGNYSYKTL
jgi:hypothetical protein